MTLFTSAAAQEAVRVTYCHVIDVPHGVTEVVDGKEAAKKASRLISKVSESSRVSVG